MVILSLSSLIAGLFFASTGAVSAAQALSPASANLIQDAWPTVGVGAGYMRFERLGIQEGLSDNVVLAVLQDSLGIPVVRHREGLNKYDGYEFMVFSGDIDDPDALSDSTVTALAETADGTILGGHTERRLEPF